EAAAGLRLAAEMLQMCFVDASLEIGAGIDAGRCMSLEEDHVAVATLVAAKEMVEADLVERRGGRIRRDVSADSFFGLVRAHDHRRRVPPDEALDPALEIRAARHEHLFVGGDRVDVGGFRGEGKLDAVLSRVN